MQKNYLAPKDSKVCLSKQVQLAPCQSAGKGGYILTDVMFSHQLSGEVERLYPQVEQPQLLRQFVDLFAQGFHVHGGHGLDFGARIAVVQLRGAVGEASQKVGAHAQHITLGIELRDGLSLVHGLHVGGIDAEHE